MMALSMQAIAPIEREGMKPRESRERAPPAGRAHRHCRSPQAGFDPLERQRGRRRRGCGGHFTLFNPAAEMLIGIGATSLPTADWADRYGVFHPDRVTPYPTDQVPLVRTLRGESCQNIEVFLRNPKRPELNDS
jgi:hypothetical protein